MKACHQIQRCKCRVTMLLRDITFWIAVSLGVICLSGLYSWLGSLLPY